MAAVGFDWIFFAIVVPWPLLALYIAFTQPSSSAPARGDMRR